MTENKLDSLYRKHQQAINEIYEGNKVENNDFDGPQLMFDSSDYYKSKVKLLFVGQEGRTPTNRIDKNIDRIVNGYKDFKLSTNADNPQWQYRKPTTPFWKACWEVYNATNPETTGDHPFLVSNVARFSEDGSPMDFNALSKFAERLNLLGPEIICIEPTAIVFFSGPNYDDKIQFQFDSKVKFEPVIDGINSRALARVSSEKFPFPIHTYRTYHPAYLKRSRRWKYINHISSLILGKSELISG